MGLLVGFPLKLFQMLFLVLRFVWPILLVLLIRWILRRRRDGGASYRSSSREPEFDGPVYTVDYEEVDQEDDKA